MTDTTVIDMRETSTSRKTKKQKKPKSPKRQAIKLIISILALFLLYNMVLIILAEAFHIDTGDLTNDTSYLIAELGTGLTALTACLITKKHTGKGLSKAVKIKGFDWSVPFMLTIFTWSACELCDHIFGSILCNFMTIEPNEDSPTTFISAICACILAPIFEELIFRFSFMGLMKEHFGKGSAIIFTSVIFAAIHLYNIQGFGDVLVGTLIAATVYYHTGNILYLILEHALHNTICQIDLGSLTLFGSSVYYERNGFVLSGVPYIIINSALLTVSLIWFVKYFIPRYCQKNELSEKTAAICRS